MNCPQCGKPMQQEGMINHKLKGFSPSYDYDTKDWIIPEEIIMEFERTFWCREETCNLRNRYSFIDGNYKYKLEKV